MSEVDVPDSPQAPNASLAWWQRRGGVAAIGVVCLLVGAGIGGAAKSSSKQPPTPAQLAAEAESTKARIHKEEVEKTATERERVANEHKQAREHAAEAREAARKQRQEAAQKRREAHEQQEEAERKLREETKVFSGSATENLGTVNVETESTLTWSCSGCSESNFIINSSSGPSTVLVNSLNETSGHTVIDEGSYKDFEVSATGPWSVRITPNS